MSLSVNMEQKGARTWSLQAIDNELFKGKSFMPASMYPTSPWAVLAATTITTIVIGFIAMHIAVLSIALVQGAGPVVAELCANVVLDTLLGTMATSAVAGVVGFIIAKKRHSKKMNEEMNSEQTKTVLEKSLKHFNEETQKRMQAVIDQLN